MEYDHTYKNNANVFGSEPDRTLKEYIHLIKKPLPVLDIGIGQGRNAFYLAKNGLQVDGIDLSSIAIESVKQIAEKENLSINAYQTSFLEFTPENTPYSAILVFGLIQILDWKSIHELINRINQWTQKGSLVFITAFSIKDASYSKYRKAWKNIGKNSYGDANNNYRTFLEPNEIIGLFPDYHLFYHHEGLGSKHRHGNGPLEQHDLIELVIEKK